MRTKLRGLTLLIAVWMLVTLLAGCGTNNQPDEEVNKTLPSASGLNIAGPGRELTAGETYQLLWDFSPTGSARETVIWQCSDESVVTVSPDGLITALGEGSCTVTGSTKSGLLSSVEVSVILPASPQLMLDSPNHVEIEEGDTYQLEWHFVPESSNPPIVTWETETPEHLTVDENGLLTAKTRIITSVIGTYGTAENRKTVKVTVEIHPAEWELLGFNSRAISPGQTLEFRYPNKAVTNVDGERIEPGRFVVWDSFNDPALDWTLQGNPTLEKSFPTVEKTKGNTTTASVTFDTPGGYKVTYSGNGWDKECFILVTDALLPDTLNLKPGESAVLIDISSLTTRERMYLELKDNMTKTIGHYERWEENGSVSFRNVCRIFGRAPGSFTIGLYDVWGNCLDTCNVRITGEAIGIPTVWASLESVSASSAVIQTSASGLCTIVVTLHLGTPERNFRYKDVGNPMPIDEQVLRDSTGGSLTFNNLTPGTTYTVYAQGSLWKGFDGNEQKIVFTTPQAPIMEASLKSVNETSATITVKSDKQCSLISGLYPGGSETPASADDIQSNALQHKTIADTIKEDITYERLTPDTSYSIFVCGIDGGGQVSQIQRVDFTTDKNSSKNSGSSSSSGSGSGSGSGSDENNTAIPVTAITGIPSRILVNQVIALNPVVQPSNASITAISWSIPKESASNITLNGSSLTGLAASTPDKPAVLRATIYKGGSKGADYVQDFPVQVLSPVTLTKPEGLKPEAENLLPPVKKDDSVKYEQEFTAAGGMGGPYQFQLKNSTLPDGWSLNAGQSGENNTAMLSGVPDTTGRYSFTIRTTDSAGNFTDYAFVLEISDTAFVPVTDITGIPDYMIEGTSITLDGGVHPNNASNKNITWEITEEYHHYYSLTGNALTSNGGTGTAKLRATIKNGLSDGDYTKDFQIQIVYPIALVQPVSGLSKAQAGVEYEALFEAVNGKPGETSYSFDVIGGGLPAGLAFNVGVSGDNTKAKLTGTPEEAGSFSFTVRVQDSDGNFTDFTFSLEVTSASESNDLPKMPVRSELPGEEDIIADEDIEESEQPVKETIETEDHDGSDEVKATPSDAVYME